MIIDHVHGLDLDLNICLRIDLDVDLDDAHGDYDNGRDDDPLWRFTCFQVLV